VSLTNYGILAKLLIDGRLCAIVGITPENARDAMNDCRLMQWGKPSNADT
jgi:hypothetical protein